ncbi:MULTISPECIES: PAS domain-containing sensor histidine kinase [Paenarthrobacter]|uniref:histidine kinase n=1 Tax=Paenarthrobacter ureafaciens TaxID=37931 RepID=A0AAX3EK42_PAEUR|nr:MULTISPECIES: PAS domain-containing sensor histidine kinase [Paenarthrobacter]MDO5863007.1 ATP-binding protein [Paenarthrobacter sp. SD-2]MDO5874076.1 ATP-binding protein [Paenarthrobacter sp. SD-1]UYV93509.1 ATP-binding protein [Paenarthrobacter ureafaciens]UYV98038.1 ATP-binding protein [Paenarthrobacter ureafaciens]
MSPDEALRLLKQSAFDSAPLATAIFRKESPKGLVFLGGNSKLDALLHGSTEPAVDPHEAPTPALIKLVATSLSEPADDQTMTVHLGDQLAAFRPQVKTFNIPGDPAEYLVVQLAALAEPDSIEHDLHSTIRQLKDLLDNSAALMYVKDLDGRYLIANHYYARRLGITAESIIGLTDYDLFPKAVADNYSNNDDMVIRTASSIEVEELLATDRDQSELDEDSRWLSIKFPLLDDAGKPYALGAISTDITDRKRAERAAREAMHDAERANRSKSEFLSRMSHELRTPLNAILGSAQLLQDLPLSPRAAESTSHILDAGKHLLALVNDVLDITWIEAGAPGIASAPVPAIDSIHQALKLVRPLAAAQDIEIASDLHGALHRYVLADTQRLRQVFINLLSNAVKFNNPQGAVRVWCEVVDGALRFLVMDTGPGMSEDDVERLFKPFVRLDQSASIEGSGLGLALSRRLVEEMGGSLGIEHTAPGEGSTFYVDMPLAPAPEEDLDTSAPEKDAVDTSDAAHATILQIEDTYANIRLVENIISGMGGLNLISATSGESGVALAQDNAPQLILLDVNLSDMSGVEVVKLLQQDQRTKDIPVIILSADATPARIAELRSMKILDYLTKPFDIEHFARTVRQALALA